MRKQENTVKELYYGKMSGIENTIKSITDTIQSTHDNNINYNMNTIKFTSKTTLKLNGVKYVNWDSKSSNFSIIYNSKKVTIDEIRTKIAEVGHDNGEYKASLETYDELPNCCRYRHTGKH